MQPKYIILIFLAGIEVNSFKYPDNEFKKVANDIVNNDGFVTSLKMVGLMMFPKLMDICKVSILSRFVTKFFRKAVHETMSYRDKQGTFRPDMINLLMQAKKGMNVIAV